jgi:hypothetical protein
MTGGLMDDPELIAAAAADAGLDPAELERWCEGDDVEQALRDDIAAARNPPPEARALDHKLGGPTDERRYTAPSVELRAGQRLVAIPGFNPVEAYETAIASLAPQLERRPKPESVEELLAWAGEPLATSEIVLVTQLGPAVARATLARVARVIPAGADCYWALPG